VEDEEQSILANARVKLEEKERQKKGRYSQIPEWLNKKVYSKEISFGALTLYSYLDCFYGGFKAGIFPKQKKIAEDMGVTTRTIQRWIPELISAGALTVTRIKKTRGGNFYVLEWFELGSPHREEESQ
jgi:hypothetical protein